MERDILERLKAVEDWIEQWEAACEKLEQELGDFEVTFVPDEALLRDKNKDH